MPLLLSVHKSLLSSILETFFQMPAEILKAYGEAGEAIVGVAHDKKADLIVCGCRGLGTIRRTIMGSVSDYVVHHSNVPVFICRHD